MQKPDHVIRVLNVITRLNIGGAAQHVILLTKCLNGQEWASTLVTGQVDPHEGDMTELAYAEHLDPIVLSTLRNGAGPVADVISFVRLYRLFRRERPTVVHLHLLKARFLGGIAARLAGVPLITETFHGTLFADYFHPIVARVLIGLERLLARQMSAVIAVSDEVAHEVIRVKVAGPDKVRVIPLGLDLDRFVEAAHRRGILRTELGLSDHAPLVGTVGRLVPIKGVRDFITAVARLVHAVPEAHFVIIGDGSERSRLEDQVTKAGLRSRVSFLGWRRDLERIYPDLDVVVLASLHEGTPVSLIEAMAAGRPVVATRVGGVPDVVQNDVTGLLIPSRNPEALANAVLRLLTNMNERRRMGMTAQARVYPRFTASRLAVDMEALYRELLAQKNLTSPQVARPPVDLAQAPTPARGRHAPRVYGGR